MKTIPQLFTAVVVGLALCLSVVAQSQSTTGLIQGTVVDPNDAVVAGAKVTVNNTETGVESIVTSNSDGFFSAPLLPLGKYRITAQAQGFADLILENVELTVGQTLSTRIELKTGSVATTVDVSSESQGVETGRTEIVTLINER